MIDHLSLEESLHSSIPFEIKSRPALMDDAYELRVHTSKCPREGDGVFYSPMSFIEATFGPTQPIWGSYLSAASETAVAVGNVMFIPPGEAVRCHFTRGARRTVSCLFDFDALGLPESVDWTWNTVDPRKAFDIKNPYIHMALHRLAEEAASPQADSPVHIKSALTFLAVELRRHLDANLDEQVDHSRQLSRAQIAMISERLEGEAGPLPTLTELANALNMSAQNLSLRFHHQTGITLRAYMSETKIKRAKRLLMDGSLLLKQVGSLAGFRSPATFAQAFRKETGTTPSQFRESFRSKHLF
jgi:AraC family transcriptional regulator